MPAPQGFLLPINDDPCTPPDVFWQINRELAELFWKQGDGATVSTRLAEPIAGLFNVPIEDAKTVLHGAMAVSAGAVIGKAGHPIVALAVGFAIFAFLERDRC